MKLFHKLVIGYFLVITFISILFSLIIISIIESSLTNYSVYREREISSFVRILNVNIVKNEKLIERQKIQNMFEHIIKDLPHVKRLTLHAKDRQTDKYMHIVSTDRTIINNPSYSEDIEAIQKNTTTILYEESPSGEKLIDITYPVTNDKGEAIAAIGAAVSLTESDVILDQAITGMKDKAVYGVIISIVTTIFLSFIFIFVGIKRIVAPIGKLKKALNSFSLNKEITEVKVNSDDEIGELCSVFNQMSKELMTFYDEMETKVRAKSIELEKQYLTDTLTGLANREALIKDLKFFSKFHLAIIDISSFKDINDSYGVELGNKVLQRLGEKTSFFLEEKDLKIYRLGGDEISIVNPELLTKVEFQEAIEQLIKSIEHEVFYFEEDDLEINISLHTGITFETEYALEKANIALINAKKEHVDCIIYSSKIHEDNRQVYNLEIISKIKSAIVNYDFIAYYQPIVDVNSNIIKYETLVRMKDKGDILIPYKFLEIAKKTKYYHEITRAMIHQAFVKFEDSKLSFSVNIEAEDISNKDTRDFIVNQLENFKEPHRVVFEIVESEDIHTLPRIREFILFIKNSGAKIAIDDFGTGYSNFSYLLDLEPDYLKIDGSLIKNIDRDQKSHDIVKTLVIFAHGLDIKVIAEYVHSLEVLEICKELNVDEFQGYYFGEPEPKLIV